jgi:hypothetical protein
MPKISFPRHPRSRWSIPEWLTVLSCIIAVLGFLGVTNYQAVYTWFHSVFIGFHQDQPKSPPWGVQPPLDTAGHPYRQASDVSETVWAMNIDGYTIRVEFKPGGGVVLSDPIYGATGRWRSVDRNSIVIETELRTISATLTTDRQGMSAELFWPGTSKLDRFNIVLRRIE